MKYILSNFLFLVKLLLTEKGHLTKGILFLYAHILNTPQHLRTTRILHNSPSLSQFSLLIIYVQPRVYLNIYAMFLQ